MTLDAEEGWFPYQKLTRKFCMEELLFDVPLKFYHGFNAGNTNQLEVLKEFLHGSNIFFMQNYLSHLPDTPQNVNEFLNWFSHLASIAKDESLFVFIDLNYNSTSTVFGNLIDCDFLYGNGLVKIAAHIPTDGEPLEIHHQDTTQAIGENIFTGEYGLQKRFLTKFYFVVPEKLSSPF